MPPEQFGGRAVPASDLYSLGATLIYLATGQHPADLPQTDDLQIEFEKAANLSPALINWLKRMTRPSLNRRLASAKEALQALMQPQEPDMAHVTVRKPAGSKISVTEKADSLEILIPPVGFNSKILQLCFFAIAWNSFILLWTSSLFFTASGINFFMVLFSLPFWYQGIYMVWQVLFGLFGRVRLSLDPQKISLTYEILGFKFNFLSQHKDKTSLCWNTRENI
jgi:serine/threonine protein kinase